MKITFAPHYKPWKACCTSEDERPVLSGVFVDPDGWLVATNGYVMVAVPCQIEGETPTHGVIIPAALVEQAAQSRSPTIEVLDGNASTQVKIDGFVGTLTMPLIPGTFPKWRGLIPKQTAPAEYHSLSPKYLLAVMTVLGMPEGVQLIAGSKSDPVIVFSCGDRAFGLIMPFWIDGVIRQVAAVLALRPQKPVVKEESYGPKSDQG